MIDCSFKHVRDFTQDVISLRQEVPIVVAGNKLDLAPARREVPIEDVSEWLFCELPKLRAKVMECSAKDDYNIKDIFRCFVTLSRIVPKNPTGESDESGLRRRCSAYGSRRYRDTNIIRPSNNANNFDYVDQMIAEVTKTLQLSSRGCFLK